DVHLSHDHDHSHGQGHEREHEHEHTHEHTHAGGVTHSHSHSHGHSHEHGHAAHEHSHHDDHDHEHIHGHEDHHHEHSDSRNFAQIKHLISSSSLSDWVKPKAIAVFQRIADAEGRIHGLPAEKVHFHEVGAVDSIVDIVGACIALEMLGKPRVLSG